MMLPRANRMGYGAMVPAATYADAGKRGIRVGYWETGLFGFCDCGDKCSMCVLSVPFPCVGYGIVAKKFYTNEKQFTESDCSSFCCAYFIADVIDDDTNILAASKLATLRRKMRSVGNIKGANLFGFRVDNLLDYVAGFLCVPCALMQIDAQLDAHGVPTQEQLDKAEFLKGPNFCSDVI